MRYVLSNSVFSVKTIQCALEIENYAFILKQSVPSNRLSLFDDFNSGVKI